MSYLYYFLYLFSVIILVDIVQSARVLCVYTLPYYSHRKVLSVLPEELAKRHDVVIITPEPCKKGTDNFTEIDVSEVTNEKWNEAFANKEESQTNFAIKPSTFIHAAHKVLFQIIDAQFTHPDVQKLIKDKKQNFDLILAEDAPHTTAAIAARFQAPIVLISSFFAHHNSFEHVGSETQHLLFPFLQKIPESFWDRISIFIDSLQIKHTMELLETEENALINKHFGKEAPAIKDVRKNVQMVFLSLNRMWDNNRAVTPSVTYMGAIHLKNPEPLPAELQNYLDRSKHGVIYMSLGSKIRSSDLPLHIVRIIVTVFGSLPYDVIWKWDAEVIPMKPKNVRLEKWLPQADLLRHPSIKLFITQGGLQSTDEAIAAKVPLLGFPVLADQYQIVQKYQEYGIGLGMELDNLKEEDFRRTILEIAENVKYRDNVHRLSRLTSDQRTDGVQRALHQIQNILDRGSYFSSLAANVSFTEYFMLDAFAPLVVGVIIFFVCMSTVIKKLLTEMIKYSRCKGHRTEELKGMTSQRN